MLSPYFFFTSPSHSSVERQGGHQVAQNSTSTTRPAACSEVSGLPERSVSVNFGREEIDARPAPTSACSRLTISFLPARIRSIMRVRSFLNFVLLSALRH